MGAEAEYELLFSIGSGQSGEVWAATDSSGGRVAVKRLRPSVEARTSGAAWRLKREFQLLADFNHPNLVKMFELREERDELWLVMEQVEGLPLDRYVRGDLSPGVPIDDAGAHRLRSALDQLSSALAELHAQGVLHRDLKPSNVLVQSDGRVVVLDFGLAMLGQEVGEAGVMTGSPPYMAPELAFGAPAKEACDWYSVGVMLYECWFGVRPFAGTFAEQLDAKHDHFEAIHQKLTRSAPDDIASQFGRWCTPDVERRVSERPSAAYRTSERAAAAPAFVGREQELDALQIAMASFDNSDLRVAAITGPSGIGKTRLLEEYVARLQQSAGEGIVVLRARCHLLDGSSFNAFEQLFSSLAQWLVVEQPELAELAHLARDIAPLFGAFSRFFSNSDDALAAPTGDAESRRRRAFAACRQLLIAIARERRVYCWVDDSQWADRDSAVLLSTLAALPDRVSLALLFTSRTLADDPLLTALRDGHEPPPLTHLALGPLAEEAAIALARQARPGASERVLRQHTDQARGLPFLLARAGPGAEGASTVDLAREVHARAARLPADARLLLECAALTSAPLSTAVAARLLAVNAAPAALHRLRVERWLVGTNTSASGFYIYHDLLRTGVLQGISDAQRRKLHRALGAALEGKESTHYPALAQHFLEGGDRERGLLYTRRAAAQAWEQLAFARAADFYTRVLELSPKEPNATRVRRAEALELAGQGQLSAEGYQSAAQELMAEDRREESWEMRRRAADQWLRVGEVERGVRELKEVLAHYGIGYPKSTLQCWLLIARDRMMFSFLSKGEPRHRPELQPVLRVCHTALIGLNAIDILRSSVFQAREARLAVAFGTQREAARALTAELAFLACGRGIAAIDQQKRLSERVAEVHGPSPGHYDRAWTLIGEGSAHYFNGEFDEVGATMAQAEHHLGRQAHAAPWENSTCRMYRCWSWAHTGKFEALRAEAPSLVESARARKDVLAEVAIAGGPSILAWLAAGDPSEARYVTERARGRFPTEPFSSVHYTTTLALCQIELYEGHAERALERISQLWPSLRRSLFLQLQYFRVEATWLRARCEWAAGLAAGPEGHARHFAAAAKHARNLRKEPAPWARLLGELLEACVCQGTRAAELGERFESRLRQLQLGATADALAVLTGKDTRVWGDAVAEPSKLAHVLLPVVAWKRLGASQNETPAVNH